MMHVVMALVFVNYLSLSLGARARGFNFGIKFYGIPTTRCDNNNACNNFIQYLIS